MVNRIIVSRYSDDLLLGEGANRKIPDGPLYPGEEVLALLANSGEQAIRTWTQRCTNDVQRLALDAADLCELIKTALQSGRFCGAEWCEQSPCGPWAACDAYQVVRREWVEHARREMDMRYYIKFAISKTGAVLLLVSCHLTE